MNRLLTLKGLSLSPTLFKVLLQKPVTNPPRPKRTPNSRQFEQEQSSPFVQEASMKLSGQAQNARRRKRKMRNCLTHTMKLKETEYGNLTNDQLYICCIFFYNFFHFVVSTMKLHALAGRSKYTKSDKRSKLQVKSIATQIARLHIMCISSPGTRSHLIPSAHLAPSAALQHSHMPAQCIATLRPPPLLLSREPFSFLIGQSWWHHAMVWHICTKWLVFVYLSKVQGCPAAGEVRAIRRVRASEHMTVITLTLHVLFRPLTYALLIFNKGWTVLHIEGQMSK